MGEGNIYALLLVELALGNPLRHHTASFAAAGWFLALLSCSSRHGKKSNPKKKSIAWSGRITVSGGVRVRVSSCGVKYPVWLLPERSLASIRPFQHGAAWGGVQERSRPDSSPQRGDQRGNAAFEIRTSSL